MAGLWLFRLLPILSRWGEAAPAACCGMCGTCVTATVGGLTIEAVGGLRGGGEARPQAAGGEPVPVASKSLTSAR